MIEVTMDDIIDFRNAGDVFANIALPLKVAYKLNKLKKAISNEADFYSTKFQEIIDKYALKDEEGNVVFSDDNSQIKIQDDKIDECNQALTDLQELKVEIDNQNLSIDDFGEDVQCTSEDLEVLMPFLN